MSGGWGELLAKWIVVTREDPVSELELGIEGSQKFIECS